MELLRGHPHEIPPDFQVGLLVLPVAGAGRAVASAAPGPVAAFVGHPVQERQPQGRLDDRAGWLQRGANSLRQVLEQRGQTRSRCQPPVAPRPSWGSAAGLPSLACLCLAFMAAAASGPRHPPLRHLHRRERESPIWGRRMVCWFTSTRGRTARIGMGGEHPIRHRLRGLGGVARRKRRTWQIHQVGRAQATSSHPNRRTIIGRKCLIGTLVSFK